MLFSFGFHSSLLLIFFVHGIVYSVLCLRKSIIREKKSYAWLGLLLFLAALYISAWMLGFAGWYDAQPYKQILLYAPTNYSWALGPVMFIYLQQLLNPAYRFSGKQWWHLFPLSIYLLLHVALFTLDKIIAVTPPILAAEIDPDYTDYVQVLGTLISIAYCMVSIRYYRLYRRLMTQVISDAYRVSFKWVRNFLLAFFAYTLMTVAFQIIGALTDVHYSGSWWYYLAFALIFYYIAISGYSNETTASVAYKPNIISYRPAILLPPMVTGSPIEATETWAYIPVAETVLAPTEPINADDELIKEKILQAMAMDKVYEDPSLSLLSLSQITGTNPSVLSRIINTGIGKNFNDMVNGYRVEALIERLHQHRHHAETLLALAFEVGFNSKATFNRAFQKHTGQSPKAWLVANGL